MSSSASSEDLPDAQMCDRLTKQFAELTETDEACGHFFLQDCNWQLEVAVNRFFAQAESGAAHSNGKTSDQGSESSDKAAESSLDEPADEHSEPPLAKRKKLQETKTIDQENPKTKDSGKSSFKFMTWNIDGIDSNNLVVRTQAVCTIIHQQQPTVIFLQEVVDESLEIIYKFRNNELMNEYFLVCGRKDQIIPYYTVILLKRSDTRIETETNHPFPTTQMGRTLLIVEAEICGAKFTLLTSHLESTKGHAAERIRQLNKAFQTCAAVNNQRTVIFAGDLNLRDEEVTKAGGIPGNLIDVWQALGSHEFTKFTWDCAKNDNKQFGRFKPRCRFDRCYASKNSIFQAQDFFLVGMNRIKTSQCFPSDHFGILCTFKVKHTADN